MKLVLVQSLSGPLSLCARNAPAASCSIPCSLNIWSEKKYIQSTSHHNPSLESQQKHALENRFLRIRLCSNDNFNPRYNQKMLIRRKTSIPSGVCFTFEQLFRPVKGTACKINQCSSKDNRVL